MTSTAGAQSDAQLSRDGCDQSDAGPDQHRQLQPHHGHHEHGADHSHPIIHVSRSWPSAPAARPWPWQRRTGDRLRPGRAGLAGHCWRPAAQPSWPGRPTDSGWRWPIPPATATPWPCGDLDDGRLRVLAQMEAAGRLAWAPDGSKLAFDARTSPVTPSSQGGQPDVYVLYLRSGEIANLTELFLRNNGVDPASRSAAGRRSGSRTARPCATCAAFLARSRNRTWCATRCAPARPRCSGPSPTRASWVWWRIRWAAA